MCSINCKFKMNIITKSMRLLFVVISLIIIVNCKNNERILQEEDHIAHSNSFPFDTSSNDYQYDCPEHLNYCIFKPLIVFHERLYHEPKLLHHPESWIEAMNNRAIKINKLLSNPINTIQEARYGYLQVLNSLVTGMIYGSAEKSVGPGLQISKHKLNNMLIENRLNGLDWTYLGYTMTGTKRIGTIEFLLKDIFDKKIAGDFVETGVWRGGSSIFARGVIRAYHEGFRSSYVCDSFAGLPPGKIIFGVGDMNWDNTPYLEVNSLEVAKNFHSVSMLDPNVIFVQGFFNNSMPHLKKQMGKISILRLDGDIYESTVDVLYHLYDKVEIGGYIIIDDWNKDDLTPPTPFPAKTAVLDFFKVHNINDAEIITIDPIAIYWQKKSNIDIQYWRYEKKQFT